MKKLIYVCLLLGFISCKNSDPVFPDYDYTTVYFPFQYPVRTLVLGDYELDNENDKKLQFLISARVAGLYENTKGYNVEFVVDPALAANLRANTGENLTILPSKYYTLSPNNQLNIEKGSFAGDTRVQLTEDFLSDPNAFNRHYVIPLRITKSNADSVLVGKTFKTNPDRRLAGDWAVAPKDFTLFGIKFVNAYHGKYLHHGKSVVTDVAGTELETVVYRTDYVERNEIWGLKTSGKDKVTVTGTLRSAAGSPGTFTMDLNFTTATTCTISAAAGSGFPVTGTGKFEKNAGEWGNKKRDVITLDYKVTQGGRIHNVKDTLVFRDKDVRFEEFVPVIVP